MSPNIENMSFVLTTSGIIVPDGPLLSPIPSDESGVRKTFSIYLDKVKNTTVADISEYTVIHHVKNSRKIYNDYTNKSDFDNYVKLLDSFVGVVGSIDVDTFLKIQANNPYIYPTMFRMCLDMASLLITDSYIEYANIPIEGRLVAKGSDNPEMYNRMLSKLEYTPATWGELIGYIFKKKEALGILYRNLMYSYY